MTEEVATEPVPEPTPASEPVLEPPKVEETPTTQSVEPLTESGSDPISAPEPVPEPEITPQPQPTPTPQPQVSTSPIIQTSLARELLIKARDVIQFRKRKKLEKIMGLYLKKQAVTNDDVEKLLHVSDATATRYLQQLEKEGKIMQTGRTGTGVSYSRM